MTVSIKFYYVWSHEWQKIHGHEPRGALQLWQSCNINNLPIGIDHPFYLLCGALSSDFREYSPYHADTVLREIERLERGEIQTYTWEGDGFVHQMTPHKVTFEHAIFGECPEWPLWTCSLAQYKAALQGWRQFIDMPKSIDSQLIVELPDDDSSHFPQS
jgi:hypothetical protein